MIYKWSNVVLQNNSPSDLRHPGYSTRIGNDTHANSRRHEIWILKHFQLLLWDVLVLIDQFKKYWRKIIEQQIDLL